MTAATPPEPDVLYRVSSGIGHITLNRPASLNAWTPDMGRALLAAVRTAAAAPEVRCVLISGAGRAFSAGADVTVPRERTADGSMDLSTRLREIYNPVVQTIRAMPKPVIGTVQGACAGLGVSLALACDLLLAAEDAYFLLAFVRLGVMPDGGTTAFLAERVGLTRANELCMLGERLPAAKAEAWGLVNAVHPVEDLAGAGRDLAARLAAAPTVALGSMKQALTAAAQQSLADQVALEAELQQRHATTHDYAEGVAAFAERRPPEFTGA